jgi:hypothetical protein
MEYNSDLSLMEFRFAVESPEHESVATAVESPFEVGDGSADTTALRPTT